MFRPGYLYRGVTLNPAVAENNEAFLAAVQGKGGLRPGSLRVKENGDLSVSTGDEYGIYMTGKQHIADTYAELTMEDQLLNLGHPLRVHNQPFTYTTPHPRLGNVHATLSQPSLGIVYKIQTAGLPGLRPPKYRTDRSVTRHELALMPEWIADEVSEAHIQPVSVVIGPDIVHQKRIRFDAQDKQALLHGRVQRSLAGRLGDLVFFAQQVREDANNPQAVERALLLTRQIS